MKILLSVCIVSGGLVASHLAAQDPARTSPPPPPPAAKQAKKAPAAIAIPKDAVETSSGFYRWTDKDGKAWTYHRTPFGVSRWPAASVDTEQDAADKRNAAGERTVAVEQGDSIRFEQSTPFGKKTWVRKKTELNETEQKVWDLQQKNGAASR